MHEPCEMLIVDRLRRTWPEDDGKLLLFERTLFSLVQSHAAK